MESKRLYRSNDAILGGVAGGLADYFDMDPTLMRVLFVLVAFVTGGFPAIPVYLILWAIMPRRPLAQ